MVYRDSINIFKFGSGTTVKSLYKVTVPACIGSKSVLIETDVVKAKIPMLFSKKSMKRANTQMNFKNDSVTMFGQKLNIIITQSGHYGIPLNNKTSILDKAAKNEVKISLNIVSVSKHDNKSIASKLHSQFAHPTANKLIKLVNAAGLGNDLDLIQKIRKVSDQCKICHIYRRPAPKPVVAMPLATSFNEVVALDLKMFEGQWILHLIDHLSRFSAACFVSSKKPQEIIEGIIKVWISVFGPPSKFLTNNGGEFVNQSFMELCESFNIIMMTTAAESPWSNGLCERHNAVLDDVLRKTLEEGKCSKQAALAWAIHAKNSLANVHGFSPYQIAIGYTPKLPSVLYSEAPALETPMNERILSCLNSIASARKAFIESENKERIKRALKHNIRPSGSNKFLTGDTVFYKR